MVFVVYDCKVRARQLAVMERVVREDKLLADLFPANIRDRMYDDADHAENFEATGSRTNKKHFELLRDDVENPKILHTAPLADLYLGTTVFFGDIAGTQDAVSTVPVLVRGPFAF